MQDRFLDNHTIDKIVSDEINLIEVIKILLEYSDQDGYLSTLEIEAYIEKYKKEMDLDY